VAIKTRIVAEFWFKSVKLENKSDELDKADIIGNARGHQAERKKYEDVVDPVKLKHETSSFYRAMIWIECIFLCGSTVKASPVTGIGELWRF